MMNFQRMDGVWDIHNGRVQRGGEALGVHGGGHGHHNQVFAKFAELSQHAKNEV